MNVPSPQNRHGALVFGQSNAKLTTIDQEWNRTQQVLKSNPSLVTSRILLMTLHNKPPVDVIEFMLQLNPQAATIPKEGPTALEIAVKQHASIDVILLLLQTCPFALVSTDMAEVARETGRDNEPQLMAALLKPLNHWLAESSKLHKKRLNRPEFWEKTKKKSCHNNGQQVNTMKAIASTVIQAQKRQNRELQAHRHEVEIKLARTGDNLVKEMEDRQSRHFKTQLLALDLKGKSMQQKNQVMEKRIAESLNVTTGAKRNAGQGDYEEAIQKLEETINGFNQMIHDWKVEAESKMEELESRLEQECRVNTYFRNDTRFQLDQMSFVPHCGRTDSPVVFSSPIMFPSGDDAERDDAEESLFSQQQLTPSLTSKLTMNRKRNKSNKLWHHMIKFSK